MLRKSLAALLFSLACSVTLYAEAAEEAPAPRPAEAKKPDATSGRFGAGKFGGKFGGKVDPEKLKEKFKNIDPEKLKELKEKFGKGGLDPEKLKELKEKFGDKFGKGGFDPEKLKELKEKFKKD
ncbi:MAG: hypothetical protein C0467_04210 [Planctomycetaceae bacterium]|nr:hypothetical protein [Planctomycetaceae bacterium]